MKRIVTIILAAVLNFGCVKQIPQDFQNSGNVGRAQINFSLTGLPFNLINNVYYKPSFDVYGNIVSWVVYGASYNTGQALQLRIYASSLDSGTTYHLNIDDEFSMTIFGKISLFSVSPSFSDQDGIDLTITKNNGLLSGFFSGAVCDPISFNVFAIWDGEIINALRQ